MRQEKVLILSERKVSCLLQGQWRKPRIQKGYAFFNRTHVKSGLYSPIFW